MSRLHSTRRFFGALLSLAMLLPCAAGAQADAAPAYALRLEYLPSGYDRAPARLVVDGTAPRHCLPVIARADLDGLDLSIVLRQPQLGCSAQSQAFTLRVQSPTVGALSLLRGQVYRVRVYVESGGAARLALFRLVETAGAGAVLPENGFWWSTAGQAEALRGTGAGIERQGEELALALYGFADDGTPTWQFGSARLHGRTARVPLVRLAGGDPLLAPIGAAPQALPGPRMEIEFTSPTSARAWLVEHEGGVDVAVRPMDFARGAFSTEPAAARWSGRWALVPDEGEARVLELAESGGPDAPELQLVDAISGARLDCRLGADRSTPDLCALTLDGSPLADFDRIGFDRLDGHAAQGGRISLLRVSR